MASTRKKLIWRVGIVCSLALCITLGQKHLVTAISASVNPYLFFRSDVPPRPGDYVTFILDNEFTKHKPFPVTKKMICGPHDLLERKGAQFWCNGVFLGDAKTTSLRGRIMPVFEWNGPVPEGKAFVVGEHIDSYDSRYYGLINIAEMQRVVPII